MRGRPLFFGFSMAGTLARLGAGESVFASSVTDDARFLGLIFFAFCVDTSACSWVCLVFVTDLAPAAAIDNRNASAESLLICCTCLLWTLYTYVFTQNQVPRF
jgi:hypothetical protein